MRIIDMGEGYIELQNVGETIEERVIDDVEMESPVYSIFTTPIYSIFTSEKGEYPYFDTYKKTLTIYGQQYEITLIPIGSIYINEYNAKLEEYYKKGGSPKKVHTIPLDPNADFNSYYWPAHHPKTEENIEDFSDVLNVDLGPFIKTYFTRINNEIYPIFEVEKISDLIEYDKYRLVEKRISIDECKYCKRAYLHHTTAVMCPICRAEGVGNKRKYNNLKDDPINFEIRRIKQRKRIGKGYLTKFIIEYEDNYKYNPQIDRDDFHNKIKTLSAFEKQYHKTVNWFEEHKEEIKEIYDHFADIIEEWEQYKKSRLNTSGKTKTGK